jgi:hypothetical protein
MAVRLSALHSGHPLPPGRFLVLISVRGWVDPRVIVRLEGLGQLHLIGIRSRNLSDCSIVPQPITLPRAPPTHGVREIISCKANILNWNIRVLVLPMGIKGEEQSWHAPGCLENIAKKWNVVRTNNFMFGMFLHLEVCFLLCNFFY